MINIKGTGLGTGLCIGRPVLLCERKTVKSGEKAPSGSLSEQEKLESGVQRTADSFYAQSEGLAANNPELAQLLETYLLILEGGELTDAAIEKINDGMSAEDAVIEAGEEFAMIFEASGDDYTAGRAADIRDIASKVAANISCGGALETAVIPENGPFVLCAEDISPADLLSFISSGKRPDGIVLAGGSLSGHTAIIARTFGIPAVIGLGELPGETGDVCAVDAYDGTVVFGADAEFAGEFEKRINADRAEKERLLQYKNVPSVTKGGRELKIFCNIASPDDVNAVFENGGEGIGLFRSEFLYIGRDEAPTEEEQYRAYSSVLSGMKGRPVIIRTCDVGSDKSAAYLDLPEEENPALGTRGIRISLARPEMFRTQLRALYRASVFGDLSVMFPMISRAEEITAAKDICASVRGELDSEGIKYGDVKLGIMIETPAAAVMADEFAGMCDFFSIGSNDLAQYTAARDRAAGDTGKTDPALLRLIASAVKAAHEKGITAGICGELASDPEMTDFLLETGIDEISVPAASVLRLREAVANHE